ncbi:vegetative cell wall protein gp1-like [Dromiciops gliroides]|uniref:vegetative cell wall protein gp1-like n=1 Tax=Dromiciops gliroides TaxID=33562 RepID=UPI001CC49A7A|nr:vegetative cell wall protein gp1-like [Dromiciops gliroides]
MGGFRTQIGKGGVNPSSGFPFPPYAPSIVAPLEEGGGGTAFSPSSSRTGLSRRLAPPCPTPEPEPVSRPSRPSASLLSHWGAGPYPRRVQLSEPRLRAREGAGREERTQARSGGSSSSSSRRREEKPPLRNAPPGARPSVRPSAQARQEPRHPEEPPLAEPEAAAAAAGPARRAVHLREPLGAGASVCPSLPPSFFPLPLPALTPPSRVSSSEPRLPSCLVRSPLSPAFAFPHSGGGCDAPPLGLCPGLSPPSLPPPSQPLSSPRPPPPPPPPRCVLGVGRRRLCCAVMQWSLQDGLSLIWSFLRLTYAGTSSSISGL